MSTPPFPQLPTFIVHAPNHPPHPICATLALSAILMLASCKNMPGQQGTSGDTGSYVQSCLTGALLAGGIGILVDKKKQQSGRRLSKTEWAAALAGGCTVGLAVTAVGKLMDARQQARHEEAMQREARRLALEQQTYANAQARANAMPAATSAQRANRDAALEKARADYQANFTRPVNVELGDGGQTTVTPQVPAEAPKPGQPVSCYDQTVLVQTARGQAKQVETWCPNAQGVPVRAEARDAA